MSKLLSALRLLLLLIFLTNTFQHKCVHDEEMASDSVIGDPAYSIYSFPEGRMLTSTYNNLVVMFDSSTFTGASDAFSNYVLNSILPIVSNLVSAMVKVPTRSGFITANGKTTLCGGDITVPSSYNTVGVDVDLLVFLRAVSDSTGGYLAKAGSCLQDSTTSRPIIGRMIFNTALMDVTTKDTVRESHIMTTLHELTHVLGFSSSLYNSYIDPSTGNPLTGHVSTITSNGYSTTILNLPTLTSKIQSHFGCSSAAGAYIENEGNAGSAGSHFERRVFYNDYMTASAILDVKITQFILALLEGTGWYQVNYAMAAATTYGKNEGCSFLTGICMDTTTQTAKFTEFCAPLLKIGPTWTLRSAGTCGAFKIQTSSTLPSAVNWWGNNTIVSDTFADNCPMYTGYSNLDCEDSTLQSTSTLPTAEVYGYGSKAFITTLYPNGKGTLSKPYGYCFLPTCLTDASGNYYIQIPIGSQTATCTSATTITVTGYSGVLYCPDPSAFCNQIMTEGFCRRGCSARGTCVNRICVCTDGWTGYDCSKPNYVVGCSRCASSSSGNTCYLDTCVCDPSSGCSSSSSSPSQPSSSGQPGSSSQPGGSILVPVLASVLSVVGVTGLAVGIIWYVKKARLAKSLTLSSNKAEPAKTNTGEKPPTDGKAKGLEDTHLKSMLHEQTVLTARDHGTPIIDSPVKGIPDPHVINIQNLPKTKLQLPKINHQPKAG